MLSVHTQQQGKQPQLREQAMAVLVSKLVRNSWLGFGFLEEIFRRWIAGGP